MYLVRVAEGLAPINQDHCAHEHCNAITQHVKMNVFWDAALRSLTTFDRRFRVVYCRHYHGETTAIFQMAAQRPRRQSPC
jgi:hypothetical protein